ncbi:MAG TPA: hypothetical protein PLM75_07765, partial [bacterium]|nr:hypothetical protein [bacterium]
SNTTGVINFSFFIKKYPSLEATLTNFVVKIATITCTALATFDSTTILWNTVEPRKTTLSQIGFNKISRYDTFLIYFEYKPSPPIVINFLDNICTNHQAATFTITKQYQSDSVLVYVNNTFYDTILDFSDTTINYVYTFTNQETHTFYFITRDTAGLLSDSSIIYRRNFDTTLPVINSYWNTISTIETTPEIIVTYSDANSGINTNAIAVYVDTGSGLKLWSDSAVTPTQLTFTPLFVELSANTYTVIVIDNAANSASILHTVRVETNHIPYLTQSLPNIVTAENTGAIIINLNNYAADTDAAFDSLYWSIYTNTGSIVTKVFTDTNILRLTPVSDTYGSETITLALTDGKDTILANLYITLENIPNTPAIPILLFPQNNYDTKVFLNVVFSWSADTISENTDTYQLQVDTNFNFVNPLINVETTATQYSYIPMNIDRYYWRVRGKNSLQIGEWSLMSSFTTSHNDNHTMPQPQNIVNNSCTNAAVDTFLVLKQNTTDTTYFYANNILRETSVYGTDSTYFVFNYSQVGIQGQNTFYFVGVDSQNIIANTTPIYTIIYDTVAPVINSYWNTISTIETTPEIIVTYSDANSGINTNAIAVYVDTGSGLKLWSDSAVTPTQLTFTPLFVELSANTYTVIVIDNAANSASILHTVRVETNHIPYLTQSLPNIVTAENTGAIIINLNNYAADTDAAFDSLYWSIYTNTGSIVTKVFTDTNILRLTPVSDTYGSETITLALTDGKDTILANLYITLENIPNTPAIPILLFPQNNYDTKVFLNVVFSWSADTISENTDTYQLQVDTNFNFVNPLINVETTATQYSYIPMNIDRYYWRVRGKNSLQIGEWSLKNILNVKDLTPPNIINYSLTDMHNLNMDISDTAIKISACVSDTSIIKTLSFAFSINNTSYTDQTYFWLNVNTDTYTKIFTLPNLLNVGDTIYYKIYAEDIEGNYTNVYSFVVVSTLFIDSPVFSPNLKNKTNNALFTLTGTKNPRTNVRINDSFTAINTSDTEWQITLSLTSETNI